MRYLIWNFSFLEVIKYLREECFDAWGTIYVSVLQWFFKQRGILRLNDLISVWFFLLKLDDRDFRLCIRKFAREYLLSTMLFFKVSIFPDQPAYIVLKIQLSIFRYINSEILHSYTVFPAIQFFHYYNLHPDKWWYI